MAEIDAEKSGALVRNILRTGLATLCHLRRIFPSECFVERSQQQQSGIPSTAVRRFRKDLSPASPAGAVRSWLEDGAFDAFRLGFLESVAFAVSSEDPTAATSTSAPLSECYVFRLRCPEGVELVFESQQSQSQSQSQSQTLMFEDSQQSQQSSQTLSRPRVVRTNDTVRVATTQLLRNICAMTQTLQPLPALCRVHMRLQYSAGTPDDYEPPNFVPEHGAPDNERLLFASTTPLHLRLGSVATEHHSVDLSLFSVADALVSTSSAVTPQPSQIQGSSVVHQKEQPDTPSDLIVRLARGDLVRGLESLLLAGTAAAVDAPSLAEDLGITQARAKRLLRCFASCGCLTQRHKPKRALVVNRPGIQRLLFGESEDIDVFPAHSGTSSSFRDRGHPKHPKGLRLKPLCKCSECALWTAGIEWLAASGQSTLTEFQLCEAMGVSRHDCRTLFRSLESLGCAQQISSEKGFRLNQEALLRQVATSTAPFAAPPPTDGEEEDGGGEEEDEEDREVRFIEDSSSEEAPTAFSRKTSVSAQALVFAPSTATVCSSQTLEEDSMGSSFCSSSQQFSQQF